MSSMLKKDSTNYNVDYIKWSIICLWFMVFNATFNNISAILWQLVLLVEKTTELQHVTDKHYHILWIEYTSSWVVFVLTTVVVIALIAQLVVNPTTIRSRPWNECKIIIILICWYMCSKGDNHINLLCEYGDCTHYTINKLLYVFINPYILP